jgi:5-methylcytosine-specific restriction endonuclease McrA
MRRGSWVSPPGWEQIRAQVFEVKGRRCHHCGRPATTVDHYPVPAAAGGPAVLGNLVPACKPCNSSRGATFGNRLRGRRRAARRRAAPVQASYRTW